MLPVQAHALGGRRARVVGAQRAGHDPATAKPRIALRLGDPIACACARRRGTRPGGSRPPADRDVDAIGGGQRLGSNRWPRARGKRKVGAGDVASNRYASYRYELLERLECGIVLEGTEVKALRDVRRPAEGRLRGDPRRRAVAALRPHPALRAGLARKPRARAPAQAAGCTAASSTDWRASVRAGLTLVPTRIYFRARTPRSRSRSRAARTCTTSARRSASASPSATWNGPCAKRGASSSIARAEAVPPEVRMCVSLIPSASSTIRPT